MGDVPDRRPRDPNNSVAMRLQQLTGRPVTTRRRAEASVLVVDKSESMAGTRLREARRGSLEYIESMLGHGIRVGVVAFDTEATIVQSTVTNLREAQGALERLNASGTTHVAKALRTACALLMEHDAALRTVCIVSDGQPNDRDEALEVARGMKQNGIRILTIAVENADQEFLGELASTSSMALFTHDADLCNTLKAAARLMLESRRDAKS